MPGELITDLVPLPPASNEEVYHLLDELALFRATLVAAAQANHSYGAAKSLELIASLEKTNLQLVQKCDNILSKTQLRAIADHFVSRVSRATNTTEDELLREQLYECIARQRNRPTDYQTTN